MVSFYVWESAFMVILIQECNIHFYVLNQRNQPVTEIQI